MRIGFRLSGAGDSLGIVSLEQLRYFVTVAEEEHMTRAAQRLFISQPPLSRQIRALEHELGAQLFERTPRGLKLLPKGRVLLQHARQILHSVDALQATIHDPAAAPDLPDDT